MKCLVCNTSIEFPKRKYCSTKCRHKSQIPAMVKGQRKRSIARKLKLITLLGGSCQVCGYDKNLAALVFHHKDPSKKDFWLTGRKLSNTNMKVILHEAKKCQLLCCNCHSELHHPDLDGWRDWI